MLAKRSPALTWLVRTYARYGQRDKLLLANVRNSCFQRLIFFIVLLSSSMNR